MLWNAQNCSNNSLLFLNDGDTKICIHFLLFHATLRNIFLISGVPFRLFWATPLKMANFYSVVFSNSEQIAPFCEAVDSKSLFILIWYLRGFKMWNAIYYEGWIIKVKHWVCASTACLTCFTFCCMCRRIHASGNTFILLPFSAKALYCVEEDSSLGITVGKPSSRTVLYFVLWNAVKE